MTPLGTAFGRFDALKRRLYDLIQNPSLAAQQALGGIAQSAQETQALQNQAFGNPQRPFQVTDEQALARLTNMIMGGPLGFAPAGITKAPTLEEFKNLVSKGKMQTAKTKQQEINDLQSGKSKFAELNLNWDDPATYKLADKLEAKGFKSFRDKMSDDPNPPTYFFKNFEDVKPVLSATNQAQKGKAYGYSDADIARFYTERYRGYPEEQVYKLWLQDSQGLLGP